MTKAWILSLLFAPVLFAQGQSSERSCRNVGGSILTNVVDPTDTMGSATGDLAGGLGVQVLSVTGPNNTTILRNHHHWVTVQADTILFDDADATLFPTPISGCLGPAT